MSAVAASGPETSAPSTSSDVLLQVRDVHVRLQGSHILQGVGFDVPRRGVSVILGRNGVGKTTTLRAILGIVPRSGSVVFDGQSLDGLPTFRTILRGIGYVPEDREVFHELSVQENLRLAERRGVEPRYELAHQLFPELKTRARQLAGSLSGGQQQMLSIARAMLNPARLLLIDEPTKGLSPRMVTETVQALEHMAENTTILLVEQNLAAVRRLARHALVVADGRVVHTGAAAPLLADEALTRRLLGVSSSHGAKA